MKQDLAPIAPKKRLSPTLSNKEILEKHYMQTNTHHKCNTMILLIKKLPCKAIPQLNLKEIIKNHTHPKHKNETQRISMIAHRILQVIVHHLCNKSNLLQTAICPMLKLWYVLVPFV